MSKPDRIDGASSADRPAPPAGYLQRPGLARPQAQSAQDPRIAYAVQPGADPLRAAFARRQFVVPWQGCEAVLEDDAEAALSRIFATPRREPAVAYIHVPYCQNHCLFCGFFQNSWRADVSADFVDDVIAEIARQAQTPLIASAPIEAVYIGGGTPSALAAEDLARLVAALHRHLPLVADCEITVEGRTYDFGLDKAKAALDAGANRISLGIQSFDTALRKRLGRKASGEEAQTFLSELVALDRASIGCDLIYGLPGQDLDVWRKDVQTAIDLGLHGLSIYALNVWPTGPLSKAIGSGKLAAAGTLAFQAEAYAAAAELLTGHGRRQISQAHFISSARERNRYNKLVKAGATCLAFGPGAGGQAHDHRWRNIVDIPRRRALVGEGRMPIEGLAVMPRDQRARTLIAAGLEGGALDLAAVEAAAPGFLSAASPLVEHWAQAGLGALEAASFRTSRAGAFWITTLTNGLYAVLDQLKRTEPASKGVPA